MSDRIETGAGEVAADEDDLAQAGKQKAGLMGGAVRALGRRIEGLSRAIVDLGDSLRGRISRGEDQIDALEAEVGKLDLGPTPSLGAWMDRIQGAVAKLQAAETQHAGKAETMTALTMANLRASKHATRLESLETRLAAIDRTVSAQGQRIGALEGLLSAEAMRRAAAATRPAPSSPELEERRGAGPVTFPIPEVRPGRAQPRTGDGARPKPNPGALRSCSYGDTMADGVVHRGLAPCYHAETGATMPDADLGFLSPPPIARAIGRAVMAAAEKIGGPQAMIDAHAKVSAEVKAAPADLLKCRIFTVRRMIEEGARTVDVIRFLDVAIEEGKRAGVIP